MRNIQNHFAQPPLIFGALIAICISILLPVQAQCPATLNIFQTSLLEPPQPGKELSTQQLQQILRSEEHTSELQSRLHLVCRLLLEKKKIREHMRMHGLTRLDFRQSTR